MVLLSSSVRNVARRMATMWGDQARKPKVDRSQLQPLIYPWSYTANVVQQDWIFFLKQCWWPRYWLYASIICYPLWIYIDMKVNSPEAKLAWEKKKALDFKKDHLKEWEVLD